MAVRIPVGVAADRSLSTVFEPLIAASARAQAQLRSDAEATAAFQDKSYARAVAAAENAADAAVAAAERVSTTRQRAAELAAAGDARAAAKASAAVDKAAVAAEKAAAKSTAARVRLAAMALSVEAKATAQMEAVFSKTYDKGVAEAEKAARKTADAAEKAAKKEIQAAEKASAAKIKADERASAAAIKLLDRRLAAEARAEAAEQRRAQRHVTRVRERYFVEQQREGERTDRERTSRMMGVGREAAQTFAGVARRGMQVGGEILRGTGVSFDIGAAIARRGQLESAAVAISNAAYKEGGERMDPKRLVQLAREQGQKYSLDPSTVLGGLAAYQEKTGDLPTAMAGLEGLTRLAKATNTSLDDMISAAGDVGTALGDVGQQFKTPEDKARAIERVMRGIAAQGQEGAVEIKALSVQMAKLAAASGFFTGDREENLRKMGALVQLSRQAGGASSSIQAATSIAAFVNTLRTPARRAKFAEAGVDLEDKATGMLKDPFEIIRESLRKTGGDTDKMKKLFANVLGDKPVTALAIAYKQAGGGEAGIAEVNRQLARFSGVMTSSQIQSNIDLSEKTTASRAQKFQNQLDTIAASLAERVLPAMEKLAPKALEVADALSKMVSIAAENPGKAIVLAIVASIAKAQIGASIASAIPGLLSGAGGMAGAAAAGSLGLAGKAGLVGLAGAAGYGIGSLLAPYIFEPIFGGKEKGAEEASAAEARRLNLLGKADAEKRRTGKVSADTLGEIERMRAETEARVKAAEAPTSVLGAMFSTEKTIGQAGAEQADAANLKGLRADLARLIAVTEANKPPKSVTVDNMPAAGAGGAAPVAGAGTSNTSAPVVAQ